jgi:putative addiction module component (TIGR02574 family)
MRTLSDLELQAMELTEADRAALAAHLLDSLPAILSDDDGGVAEALRRDAELERDPAAGVTLDELRRSVRPSR